MTVKLLFILAVSAVAAVLCTMYLYTARFGWYAWAMEHEVVPDGRTAYKEWILEEAPKYDLYKNGETADIKKQLPFLLEKKDPYITLMLIEPESNRYLEVLFAEILDVPFWGAWMWSDADIAARGMDTPMGFSVQFRDGDAIVELYSYRVLEFIAPYYLMIAILDFLIMLVPVLVFIHRRMRYLGRVRAEALVMAGGDLEQVITIKGTDEISSLASELDQLRQALKTSLEKERRAHQDNQELIRAVSHDLRTPLTTLYGYLEILRMQKGDAANYPEYVRRCLEKTEEIRGMSDKMFEYALVFESQEKVDTKPVPAEELERELGEQAEYLRLQGFRQVSFLVSNELPGTEDSETEVETETAVTGILNVNPFLLKRLVSNLCSNILRYGDKNAPVKISLRVTADVNRASDAVSADEAPATAYLSAVFVNCILPSRQAAGSGVGLKSAEKIAALHGGTLTVSETEGFFRAEFTLPLQEK